MYIKYSCERKKVRKKEEEEIRSWQQSVLSERTLSYIYNDGNIVGRNINDKRDF